MAFPAKQPNPYEKRISRLERLARNAKHETARVGTGEDYLEVSSIGQLRLSGRGSEGLTLRPELQQEEIRKVLKPDSIYVGALWL